MPTNKNAQLRYQILDRCFSDFQRKYFIEDLLDRVNEALMDLYGTKISIRQIREDIKYMKDRVTYNAPIEAFPCEGRKCYYRYADRNYSIFNNELSVEELALLRSTIDILGRFRGVPAHAWLEDVISNLEFRFGLRGKKENVIGFEQNPFLKGLNLLPEIIDAAVNHQVLRIAYRNYKNREEERVVVAHPWYIKQYNNRWFLMAYDAEADRITNFALDRIEKFRVEEGVAFIPNKKIDFEHYFDDVFGVTIPPSDVEKIRVVLQFSQKQYPYIVSKPLHRSQEIVDDENCILSVEVRPTYEFTQVILSFGKDVKVLEPEFYRQEILENLRRNLQNYDGMQIDCTDNK